MYLVGDSVKLHGKSGYQVLLIQEENGTMKYLVENQLMNESAQWTTDEDLTYVED